MISYVTLSHPRWFAEVVSSVFRTVTKLFLNSQQLIVFREAL